MADTGAPHFIPYVEPTDLVRDYPAADEASADAIAAALDAIPVLPGIGSNVVQAVKTNQQATTSNTFVDVIGLEVTITPSSADSKILLMTTVNTSTAGSSSTESCEVRFAGGNSNAYNGTDSWSVVGGTTAAISFFPADSLGAHTSSGIFLDAPAQTSPVTYKVQFRRAAPGTARINRARGKSVSSSLTAIEVAA